MPIVLSAEINQGIFPVTHQAPVAQLDRVIGFEPIGRGFESLRARHLIVQ